MAENTTKKKPFAECGGYEMRIGKLSADGSKIFWRCTKKDCKGRAVSDINSKALTETTQHSHIPSPMSLKVKI